MWDVPLHVFPGAREGLVGGNGTSRMQSWHGRGEDRLDFATLPGAANKACLILKCFSSAWCGEVFVPASYSLKWQG